MKVLLVDGTNLVMRWACAMMGSRQSEATEADALPVLRNCEAALRDCTRIAGAGYVVVALDSDGPTWRHELFPAYKANRERNGGTAAWSRRLRDHLDDAGWAWAAVQGFEGDDVIATLAARAQGAGHAAAALSGDSDLLALAASGAEVYGFGGRAENRFVRRGEDWICEKFGISRAMQLPLYKALVGEPGDGLPGVSGIGPVKAKALLKLYPLAQDLLEGVVLSGGRRRQLRTALALVTLRTDCPVASIAPSVCRIPAPGGTS